MNKLIGLLSLVILLIGSSCSTTSPERMARKVAEQVQDSLMFVQAQEAIQNREFVLEADRIDFRRGRFAYVTPNTNFISVHGDRATIQLAFNSPYAGPNGIGGITVDGLASNVKMTTNSKGDITYSMSVQGAAVSATVTFQMFRGSNRCSATVSPNFSGNRITFSGLLYPESESNVFKGRSI